MYKIWFKNIFVYKIMISFGVIRKTEELVDFKMTNIKTQIEDILDDPNIYEKIEIKKDTNENMEKNILDLISKEIMDKLGKKKITLSSNKIMENKDHILISYFIDKQEDLYGKSDDEIEEIKNNFDKKELNMFGSQIVGSESITDVYLVKYSLKYTIEKKNIKTEKYMVNLERHDLENSLYKVYVKTGFVLNCDGTFGTYDYIEHPIEHLIITDKDWQDNYRTHEYEIFNRVIIVTIDIRENEKLNLNASYLTGYKTFGTVFIGMYEKSIDNENKYVDTTKDIMKKIINIRGTDQKKTENFSIVDNNEYINFENLIEQESLHVKELKYDTSKVLNEDV